MNSTYARFVIPQNIYTVYHSLEILFPKTACNDREELKHNVRIFSKISTKYPMHHGEVH
jgi:hypothetical protein